MLHNAMGVEGLYGSVQISVTKVHVPNLLSNFQSKSVTLE